MSGYAFLIVVIFSIIGTINTRQPISELTMTLILFVVPCVLVFTWYANNDTSLILSKIKSKISFK